jgi:lipopolysaccharide biosynthesis protein
MSAKKVKFVAFYLPQFHTIPENDDWWGKGFTEWTNVKKAKPLFHGHYQPHIPRELGYYDLGNDSVLEQQATMAQKYGVSAFCYYHYWFNGKKLLETPIEQMLSSGSPDFPFMLCWANENWTRRWDGQEQQILMAQNYEHYNTDQHAEYLSRFFRDQRYLRVNGKPIFSIYRADKISNFGQFITRLRASLKKFGVSEIEICTTTTGYRSDIELTHLGIDKFVDFWPSHNKDFWRTHDNMNVNPTRRRIFYLLPKYLSGQRKFALTSMYPKIQYTNVYNYSSIVQEAVHNPLPDNYYPCVVPSWDNTARRKTGGLIMQNDDPEIYECWLQNASDRVSARTGDQVVFINAWNEWGEGCHLEPDVKFGIRFLEVTKRVADKSRLMVK